MDDVKQRKLREMAEEIAREKQRSEREAAKEAGFRKRVFEAIMTLTDTVIEQKLRNLLPLLDRSSWWEVVEERFLADSCGFPLCDAALPRRLLPDLRTEPRYRIDRAEGKIFESAHTDRRRFCSARCLERARHVAAQLADEPLWISGKTKEIDYSLEPPISSSAFSLNAASPPPRRMVVEVVDERPVVQRLNELIVAEGAASDDEEREREEGEEERMTAEDTMFLSSIQRYCGGGGGGGGGGKGKERAEEEKRMEVERGKEKKRSEEEKLRVVRERIKSKGAVARRTVRMTDALPLTRDQLRQQEGVERQLRLATGGCSASSGAAAGCSSGKQGGEEEVQPEPEDEEPVNGARAEHAILEGEEAADTVPFTGEWEVPARLFVSWITRRTAELVSVGGRRPVTEVDRLMRRFYAGERADEVETEESVVVPLIDSVDVHKRRIEILMTSLKSAFLSLEGHLHVRATRLEDARALVTSFALDADSVTGWGKRETRVVVLGMWAIICLLSDELEADFFPNRELSHEIRTLLEFWQLEEAAYRRLVRLIRGRIQMHMA